MAAARFNVSFRQRREAPAPPIRVPRTARLLAVAHAVNAEIEAGRLRELADAAQLAGVTRPRMTQIANLALLAPEIQEALLGGALPIGERDLRPVAALPLWADQLAAWRRLTKETSCPA